MRGVACTQSVAKDVTVVIPWMMERYVVVDEGRMESASYPTQTSVDEAYSEVATIPLLCMTFAPQVRQWI